MLSKLKGVGLTCHHSQDNTVDTLSSSLWTCCRRRRQQSHVYTRRYGCSDFPTEGSVLRKKQLQWSQLKVGITVLFAALALAVLNFPHVRR